MKNTNVKSFRDLIVWQKAADLAVLVYRKTELFPVSELYGITNQMRRATISVSSNIAEGFKRYHKKEKQQFYNIAYGSIAELESQLEIASKLDFLSNDDHREVLNLVMEISKMIDGLIKSTNNSLYPESYILNSDSGGQALIEVLIASAVLSIAVMLLMNSGYVSLLSVNLGTEQDAATSLAQEGLEATEAIAKSDWHNIYNLTGKGVTEYYPVVSGGVWTFSTSTANRVINLNGQNYNRWIIVSDVSRDLCGTGNISTASTTVCTIPNTGVADDPSTQKITINVVGKNISDLQWVRYMTRSLSTTSLQNDWSGGAGQVTNPNTGFSTPNFNNKFSSDSNPANPDINVTTIGQIKLSTQ